MNARVGQGGMTSAEQVLSWNDAHPPCTAVTFEGTKRMTRCPAQVLSDGRAVIWLYDIRGAIDLDRVRPT